MKIVLSFCAGIAVCSVLFFAVNLVMPVKAMDEGSSSAVSANDTGGLSGLLPDFEKIYRDALTMPFEKAESKITDPDIAEYYRALMDRTGLVPSKTTSR
jgi:hypothetical protein